MGLICVNELPFKLIINNSKPPKSQNNYQLIKFNFDNGKVNLWVIITTCLRGFLEEINISTFVPLLFIKIL